MMSLRNNLCKAGIVFLVANSCLAANGSNVENKMAELQITLPKVSAPVANYVSAIVVGNMVYISGQLPMEDGKLKYNGQLGNNVSVEQGVAASRLCALNILAQLKHSIGSLDKVKKCVKLTGFVNSNSDFTAQPQIINGASDLIVSIFGEKGKHARAAVGVSSLPFGAPVEIEAIFEIS